MWKNTPFVPTLVWVCLLAVTAAPSAAEPPPAELGPPEKIELASGEIIIAPVLMRNEEVVVIEHPVFGRLILPVDKIKPVKPPNPGLFGTSFLAGWTRSVNLGFNGKQGSSTSRNVNFGLNGNYADEHKRWTFKARYAFSDSDSDQGENNGNVRLIRDWLIPEKPYFFYGQFNYDYDQFESWQNRLGATLGPGWHLIEREAFTLDFRTGVNYTYEFGNRNDGNIEIPVTFDMVWKPMEGHTVTAGNTLYALVTDLGEFRNVTALEWKIAITPRIPLSLTIGAANEYETKIDPGDEHNDLRYYGALGWDF